MKHQLWGTLTMDCCGLGYCLGTSRDDFAEHFPDADLTVCGPLPADAVRPAIEAWGDDVQDDWITNGAQAILWPDAE